MIRDNRVKNQKSQAGTACVELAIAVPLLMLMMVVAADFARLFYHSITVDNAAEAGSFYGSQNGVLSADYSGITQVSKDDAADLEGVRVTPDRYCDCPDKGTKECFADENCTGFYGGTGLYGLPRAYVHVTVQQTFEPLLPWPGIPNPVAVTERVYMRVR